MEHFNPHSEIKARILASDLDGTLIPLPENQQNKADLTRIRAAHDDGRLPLIFATGRHFESVLEAIDLYNLPEPEWIICDVGSRIYRRVDEAYIVFAPYTEHLNTVVGQSDRGQVESLLDSLEGLRFQQPDHQTEHKISYQCTADQIEYLTGAVQQRLVDGAAPYSCMGSLDPFLQIGLIDVLPGEVNKAYALHWLATHANFKPDEVVYSGDSGNDEAALACGFRAIVVANASAGLAGRVRDRLTQRSQEGRLFCAEGEATSGVLEGLRHFQLI